MRNQKITCSLLAFILLSFTFISGCKEDDDVDVGAKTIEGLLYYYTNEDTKEIRVIDIDASSPFRRSFRLSDDVTLETIAQERDYLVIKVYRPATTSALAATKGKLIKSKVLEDNWVYVANNPFLGLTGITNDSYNDASNFSNNATGFIFHKIEEINGEAVFAIESAAYPGRFFSHSGHPIQGTNLLFLEEYSSPQNAPRFRLYRPKATFLEGANDVPVDAGLAG
jgi:hypothetical protein